MLEPATRPGKAPPGPTKREVQYLQFVINGEPLDSVIGRKYATDYTTALQPGAGAWRAAHVAMLRGEAPGSLPSGRVPLLLCAECGDIGCGALGAFIEVESESVTWSGFAYENNYDDAFTDQHEIGPFRFDRDAYLRLLDSASAHWPNP